MPSASSRNRRLRPLPHSTVLTSSSLRMIIASSYPGCGLNAFWDLPQLGQQAFEVLDHVAAGGASFGHPGHAGAADDRRVCPHRGQSVDVAAALDAEADGHGAVGLLAHLMEH